MANEIEFEITDYSDEVLQALRDAIPKVLEEWGLAGERFAKQHITTAVYDTPQSPNYQRTGRLRGSITYATAKKTGNVESPATAQDKIKVSAKNNEVYIGTNVEYASYVEFGTSKMKARPYLRPAIEDHIDDYKKIAEQYLTD